MPEIAIGAHLRNREEIAGALEALTRINLGQLRGGLPWPGIYRAGIRYEREIPGDAETWQSCRDLLSTRRGDCEDLACARAAELRLQGVKCRAIVVRSSGGYHAVVQYMNGRIEDPSARLGMLGGVVNMDEIGALSRAERKAQRRAKFLRIARLAARKAREFAGTPEGRRMIAIGREALRRYTGGIAP